MFAGDGPVIAQILEDKHIPDDGENGNRSVVEATDLSVDLGMGTTVGLRCLYCTSANLNYVNSAFRADISFLRSATTLLLAVKEQVIQTKLAAIEP